MKTTKWLVLLLAACSLAEPAAAQTLGSPTIIDPVRASQPKAYGLDELTQLALSRNPGLAQTQFEIEAARGRADQAGRYPNPTISFGGEEIGSRGGIHTLPLVSQEIVTAKKLTLSRAVASRDIDHAELASLSRRYALLTGVRQGYFEVLAIQRRREVLDDLVGLAGKAVESAGRLLNAKQIAELDILPLQIELNRLKIDAEMSERDHVAAWRRLVAAIGAPELTLSPVAGVLSEGLPVLDFEQVKAVVLENHPDVRSALVGISKAELAMRREKANAVPNVTLAAGYQKNFNDRENQAIYQVGVPLPLFNRNQGNIRAAQAELARAHQDVARAQNELLGKLATAFGQYASAKGRADRFRTSILPDSNRANQLTASAFQVGRVDYLRVIQAQRTVTEANLEYVRALGDAWRAASEIGGLVLQESWPIESHEKNP